MKEFVPTPEQLEWVEGLKSALEDVEAHQQGKKQHMSARDLLKELKEEYQCILLSLKGSRKNCSN